MSIELEDILVGPEEAANFLKEISNRPLGMRTISSYTVNNRIPVLKKGTTTALFSKSQLEQWEKSGRPNMAKEEVVIHG